MRIIRKLAVVAALVMAVGLGAPTPAGALLCSEDAQAACDGIRAACAAIKSASQGKAACTSLG